MAQFARPTSDISVNGWSPSTGATLYGCIDEASASDADYITNNAVAYSEVGLSSLDDPHSSSGHVVRYRLQRTPTNRTITIVVRLYQGSTQIASWTHADPPAWALYEQTLTGAQADSITDYTDLRLRFDITAIQNSQANGQISWAELEVPDAGESHSGSASISGKGSATASGKKGGKGSALTSAAGTLAAIGLAGMLAVATISTGGSLTASGVKASSGAASIAGAGSLSATGTAAESHSGEAVLSGSGSLTAHPASRLRRARHRLPGPGLFRQPAESRPQNTARCGSRRRHWPHRSRRRHWPHRSRRRHWPHRSRRRHYDQADKDCR